MKPRLFDTNIIIDALNRHEAARSLIAEAHPITISRITWIEVLAGARGAAETPTRAFLRGCQIVEIDAAIADRAATLRRETKIKLFDAIILATAASTGRRLVTRDDGIPSGAAEIERPYRI